MKEERLKEISAFATHRLVTGDILAAYALELAVELHDAERERDQARAEMDEIATAVGYGAISKEQGRLTGKELASRWDKLETELTETSAKVEQLERERHEAQAKVEQLSMALNSWRDQYAKVSAAATQYAEKELTARQERDKAIDEAVSIKQTISTAERERDQANALLSAAHAFHDLAVKERDAERVKNTALRLELESATRNISRLLAAVEKWEALAGAAITSRQEAALSRGAGGED